jgi:hypothetical protein
VPLPLGIDPGLALCVLWAVVALSLLAAISQVAPDQSLQHRADARTSNRLLDLNSHLDTQIDIQWQISTRTPIIPDADALLALRRHVERSSTPIRWLERRRTAIEIARVGAGLELLLALAFAGMLFLGVDHGALLPFAVIAFGIGTAPSVLALFVGLIAGVVIMRGSDF